MELRKNGARGTDSTVADIMRHLHARQHLGKAVIVCESPAALLSAARKQWMKLTRTTQKQRASTLNADKILKYTHMITHMQHMHFSAKTPMENPQAEVYFMEASHAAIMPIHCWTVYVLTEFTDVIAQDMLRLLPSEALIVDYTQALRWEQFGLRPKRELEQQVDQVWRRTCRFLKNYDISITAISRDDMSDIDTMDDALDTLLGINHRFLQIANDFQRALELARPIRITKELRAQYDALIILAHRVQALSPGAFTQQFLEIYNEDDTIFLYDAKRGRWILNERAVSEAYNIHLQAGRVNIAHALRTLSEQYISPLRAPNVTQ
ncbi:MAG TPA: hypothetical protein VLH38_04475 [Patescibacteria group bacterium]|nr:hypothetical protein [Patescibacteria group bacterium]